MSNRVVFNEPGDKSCFIQVGYILISSVTINFMMELVTCGQLHITKFQLNLSNEVTRASNPVPKQSRTLRHKKCQRKAPTYM
jgi:hypothetical protein